MESTPAWRLCEGTRLRDGAPCKTRTCDLLVRSQTLYPTELRARFEAERNLEFTTRFRHGLKTLPYRLPPLDQRRDDAR